MDELENVLSGEPVAEPEAEQPPAETKGEETAEPTTPVEDNQEPDEDKRFKAMLAKSQDEKRKRQAAQEKNRTLEAELEALKRPQKEVGEDDYWENPKEAVETTIDNRFGQLEQNYELRILGLSEELARSKHDDYDDMRDYFLENIAENQPHIAQEARQTANPHEYIYNVAKSQKELSEVGDIDALREKIREEERAKLLGSKETELREQIEAEIQKRSSIPGSLANERAASGNSTQVGDNESLDDIMGR